MKITAILSFLFTALVAILALAPIPEADTIIVSAPEIDTEIAVVARQNAKEEKNSGPSKNTAGGIKPRINGISKIVSGLKNLKPTARPINISRLGTKIYSIGANRTVNMLCEFKKGEFIVATGAVIDKKGYILSNAHIAEKLGGNRGCDVRKGSPAKKFATARLILIPNAFTAATSEEIAARNDLSIWKINERELAPFDAWKIDFDTELFEREQLYALSYPAELLGGETIVKSLNLVLSNTLAEASDTYIVRTGIALGAQRGSSGGILVDPYQATIRGLIFAIDGEETILQRRLFSLTPKAINEALMAETGLSLTDYLAGNP